MVLSPLYPRHSRCGWMHITNTEVHVHFSPAATEYPRKVGSCLSASHERSVMATFIELAGTPLLSDTSDTCDTCDTPPARLQDSQNPGFPYFAHDSSPRQLPRRAVRCHGSPTSQPPEKYWPSFAPLYSSSWPRAFTFVLLFDCRIAETEAWTLLLACTRKPRKRLLAI